MSLAALLPPLRHQPVQVLSTLAIDEATVIRLTWVGPSAWRVSGTGQRTRVHASFGTAFSDWEARVDGCYVDPGSYLERSLVAFVKAAQR